QQVICDGRTNCANVFKRQVRVLCQTLNNDGLAGDRVSPGRVRIADKDEKDREGADINGYVGEGEDKSESQQTNTNDGGDPLGSAIIRGPQRKWSGAAAS